MGYVIKEVTCVCKSFLVQSKQLNRLKKKRYRCVGFAQAECVLHYDNVT